MEATWCWAGLGAQTQAEDPSDLVRPGGGIKLEIHEDICANLNSGVRTLFQGECVRAQTHT